jgi:hypothetical protein
MFAPVLLVCLAFLVTTPEREVAPSRLGIPPTFDYLSVIGTNGDTFLAGYKANQLPFVGRIRKDGTVESPAMIPSAAGHAVAIASDGEGYLTIVSPPWGRTEVLLHAGGLVVRHLMEIPVAVYGAPRSVVWSGTEYVVAWRNDSTIYAARFARDGSPLGTPFEVARRSFHAPWLARAGADVILAATVTGPNDVDEVQIFRIGGNTVSPYEVLHPGRPAIVDFIRAGDRLLLLLRESIPGTSVLNLYRLEPGESPRIPVSFVDAEWISPALLEVPGGALIYGTSGTQIMARRLGEDGAPMGERMAILDARGPLPLFVHAASNGDRIVFGWSEPLIEGPSDVVMATMDARLTSARGDGTPDGILLARGASSRTQPRVATADGTSLIVWQENFEGRRWLAGAIAGRELEISEGDDEIWLHDVATDGKSFFVAWVEGDKVLGRRIDTTAVMGPVLEIAGGYATAPRVAGSRAGFLVVWEDPDLNLHASRYNSFVFGRRIDGEGRIIDADRIQLAGRSASAPAIASDGERYLLTWTAGYLCLATHCALNTTLNLNGRVFSADLHPLSSELVISDEPLTNEREAELASSGDGWLVTWSAERRIFDESISQLADLADAGYAFVSKGGFLGAAHRPVPPVASRTDPAVSWNGRHYLLVSRQQSNLVGTRIAKNGVRVDHQDTVVAQSGSEPALAGSLLVYERVVPESGIGAAPQVFMREILDESTTRRRAVAR